MVKWIDKDGEFHTTFVSADTYFCAEQKVWNENDNCINVLDTNRLG